MDSADLFEKEKLEQLMFALDTLEKLGTKVCCVIDNPPYMGTGNCNQELKDFVYANYPDSKSDLMAAFMECGLTSLENMGMLGMINQHSWMFLSSYKELREKLISESFTDTLLHLGPRTFPEIGGEVVQNASFTFINDTIDKKGVFFRLINYKDSNLKREKFLEGLNTENCGWRYKIEPEEFSQIDGSPICYWFNKPFYSSFKRFKKLDDIAFIDGKNVTGKNDRFFRMHWEIERANLLEDFIPIAKGGDYRKWQGNIEYLIDWREDAKKLYKSTKSGRLIKKYLWFRDGLTFSRMSNIVNCRTLDNRGTFDGTTVSFFFKEGHEDKLNWVQGFFNSVVGNYYVKAFNPTLVFQFIDIKKIPIAFNKEIKTSLIDTNNKISQSDWDTHETSIDFKEFELIRFNNEGGIDNLEDAYEHYRQYWTNKFFQLHQNEEELNRQFIEIYGLKEELTPEVPLDEITILQEELDSKKLKKKDAELRRQKSEGRNPDLPFKDKEVFAQFISYAVGCMFGRYSLDKEGLILANQGETLEDYLERIGKPENEATFLPDEDNIIPVLEDDWFEDDITGLFYQFLRASFGEQNFEKNLAFIEDKLGYDIRTYFSKYFYKDHYKRYNKRPLYWQFSSENGVFKALIYMHRYTPDTLNHMLNGYLRDFKSKLNYQKSHLQDVINSSQDAKEVNKAEKEQRKVESMIEELESYERDVLMPLATDRIEIDLDDGVLVNYNKFGQAVEEVTSLNDKKKKKKVKEFDWIDSEEIR